MTNYYRTVDQDAFPVDIERRHEDALLRAADAVADLQGFVNADPLDIAAVRTMPQMGRLLVAAAWPHMRIVGEERLSRLGDGGRVHQLEMRRSFSNGGRVDVRPYLGDARVLVAVHQSAADVHGVLHAGFPYAEGHDFITNGNCFVKDNRPGQDGAFYDSANEGFPMMVEPTQAVASYVLAAVS